MTVPPIALSFAELVALRPDLELEPRDAEWTEIEQLPHACTRAGSHVYFGLSFYQGEGTTGVGGVGRLDPDTKRLELRRPAPLAAASVRELLVIDSRLWLATENHYEGMRGPGIGLARYDWAKDRLDRFEGANEGPCGMWINDLLAHEGELWVATELGVSRYALDRNTWRHFVPEGSAPGGLREASCREIAQKVVFDLSDRPEDSDSACEISDGLTSRDRFRAMLRQRRPQIAEKLRWSGDPR